MNNFAIQFKAFIKLFISVIKHLHRILILSFLKLFWILKDFLQESCNQCYSIHFVLEVWQKDIFFEYFT